MRLNLSFLYLIFFILSFSQNSFSYSNLNTPKKMGPQADKVPEVMKDVGIIEKVGDKIDLDIPFKDENGNDVKLSKYFDGKRPVVLSLVYFGCPTLCSLYLNGVINVISNVDLSVGDEYDMVVVSIDPSEGPEMAKGKKAAYVEAYGRPGSAKGWHFLTGKDADIRKLADQVGFKYKWDDDGEQWVHAAAAIVITPKGIVALYHHGIEFLPQIFRLSLIEASIERIGNLVDQAVLFCLQYDSSKRTYAFYAFNLMRVVCGFLAFLLIAFIVRFWIKNK
jgi:protein SCO1/2